MKTYFKPLEETESIMVSPDESRDFMYLIQHAALLAMKAEGLLTVTQHREADAKLRQQYKNAASDKC